MLKVEIELDEKRLLNLGYDPENVWNSIDTLFCGWVCHMKEEVQRETRTYIADFEDEDDGLSEEISWECIAEGIKILSREEWFRKSVRKVLCSQTESVGDTAGLNTSTAFCDKSRTGVLVD